MRDIKVLPGYHEWNIFVDDEFLTSIGDITEDIDFFDSPNDFANCVFNSLYDETHYLFFANSHLYDTLNSLNENEKNQLKEQLENAYRYYMG